MEPWRDETWQGDTSQAHSAHEGAEQHSERNRRRTDYQLQQLAPNDFVNQRGAAAARKQQQKQRQSPLLLLLFTGSGCAALIYEIVWCQLLQLVIGSSAVSLGVLLGTFMGGMCLGSIALPRFVSPRFHPLRVYALLELGLGIFGLAV